MKQFLIAFGAFGFLTILAAAPASAQSHTGVPLHVNTAYNRCFFDLHPELTKAQFEEFAGELGSILRFRQLGDAPTLGKGRFDVGLQYTMTPINDRKGAWNNTFSHPNADHPLGDIIEFPRIVARFGVSDRVDVGGWGGIAPGSNWGHRRLRYEGGAREAGCGPPGVGLDSAEHRGARRAVRGVCQQRERRRLGRPHLWRLVSVRGACRDDGRGNRAVE